MYLVKNDVTEIAKLNASLKSIEANLLPFVPNSDLLLFVENNFPKDLVHKLEDYPISFVEIKFELPESLNIDQVSKYFPLPKWRNNPLSYTFAGYDIGYRHMCRFFSGEMFKNSKLLEYEYYLRLDCDSRILTPVNYDLFEWARHSKVKFGYIDEAKGKDHPSMSLGFQDTAKSYIKENGNLIQKIRSILFAKKDKLYYSNFELGHIPFFSSKTYMDYFEYIDGYNGFYSNRWGDHIVKCFGVETLLKQKESKPIRGFVYEHGYVYMNSKINLLGKILQLFRKIKRRVIISKR